MFGNKSIKYKSDGTKYKDFYYGCKHKNMNRGHKCTYIKQIREELLDEAVAEGIVSLVSKPNFASLMQEKINIKVDTLENGTQIWKYTNPEGVTVSYLPKEINGQIVKVIEFPESVMYRGNRKLATVNIGEFTGNRDLDARLATKKFLEKGTRDTRGYILHHDYKNGIIQLIDKDIHIEFSHYGGYYFHK